MKYTHQTELKAGTIYSMYWVDDYDSKGSFGCIVQIEDDHDAESATYMTTVLVDKLNKRTKCYSYLWDFNQFRSHGYFYELDDDELLTVVMETV